jgi:hypothetical protein
MWSRIGWGGESAGPLTVSGFVDILSGHTLHFTGMLGGLDGVHGVALRTHVENAWMSYAFLAAVAATCVGFFISHGKKAFLGRDAGAFLITCSGLFLSGFLVNRHAPISYQLIVLWPFAVLAVGAGFAVVYERVRRGRLVVICLVCALAVTQGKATVEAHQALSTTGGRGLTSSQIYPLAKYLQERPHWKVIAMDWGLLNQIYFLTGGGILPEALHGWWDKDGLPPPKFEAAISREMKKPDRLWVFLGPGKGFDRYGHVERVAMGLGKTLSLEKAFFERDGSVAYRVYRVIDREGAQR